MCRRESLRFLGRVPVESGLVGLLDDMRGSGGQKRVGVIESKEGEEPFVLEEGAFELGERYKRTLSAKLFEPMGREVARLLRDAPEEVGAPAAVVADA